jgi:hypothetical protein
MTKGETPMRSALFIAAGMALALASQALAATPPGSAMPSSGQPIPPTSQTTPDTSTAPPSSSAPSGSAADTSATASAAAAASLSVGEPVKDNTGATIGAISSLNTNASGQQMAVIKMGNDTFQVAGDRLGVTKDSATINMSQAQITTMIHPAAGGR